MKSIAPVLLTASLAFAACSSSTTPPVSSNPNTMQFSAGQAQTYRNEVLDTTAGEPGIPSTVVSSVMSLLFADSTLYGRTHVAAFVSVYSGAVKRDTGYYSQDSTSDLYSRDFGTQPINSNPALMSALGGPVHLGWVLQSRLGAPAGTSWPAKDTTMMIRMSGIPLPVPVRLQDEAVMQADTTVVVGGKSYTAKHANHSLTVTVTGLGGWSGTIDNYVAPALGATVLNVLHTSRSQSTILGDQKFQGLENVMLTHN